MHNQQGKQLRQEGELSPFIKWFTWRRVNFVLIFIAFILLLACVGSILLGQRVHQQFDTPEQMNALPAFWFSLIQFQLLNVFA